MVFRTFLGYEKAIGDRDTINIYIYIHVLCIYRCMHADMTFDNYFSGEGSKHIQKSNYGVVLKTKVSNIICCSISYAIIL